MPIPISSKPTKFWSRTCPKTSARRSCPRWRGRNSAPFPAHKPRNKRKDRRSGFDLPPCRRDEQRNHGRVLAVGILARAEDVEVANANRLEAIRRAERLAIQFAGQLGGT